MSTGIGYYCDAGGKGLLLAGTGPVATSLVYPASAGLLALILSLFGFQAVEDAGSLPTIDFSKIKDFLVIDINDYQWSNIFLGPLLEENRDLIEKMPHSSGDSGTEPESIPLPEENHTGSIVDPLPEENHTGSTVVPLPEENTDSIVTAGDGENGDTKKNEIPNNESIIGHIFRDADGHITDTPENRQLLEEVSNNTNNYLGTDKYGNDWYAQSQSDGSQIWVEVRNGIIFEGGINEEPRTWNPQTGLKKP